MKNLKKNMLMALSLVAVAAVSIGGTVAYLTDKEESTNTYSVGNVDIELNEASAEDVKLAPEVDQPLNTSVTNNGSEDAWVWVDVAIPAALDQETNAYENLLHWNPNGKYLDITYQNEKYQVNGETVVTYEETWYYPVRRNADGSAATNSENQWDYIFETKEIDGVDYHVYRFKLNGTLAAGATTGELLNKAYLDARIDYVESDDHDGDYEGWALVEDGEVTEIDYDFGNGASLKITAYGIQATNYATVDEAIAAFEDQWS